MNPWQRFKRFKNYRLSFKEINYKENIKFRIYIRPLLRLIKKLTKFSLLRSDNGGKKVMLGLTYRCQCKCLHCGCAYYRKDETEELSYEENLHLIRQISNLPFTFIVLSFFGGEPLLKQDIYPLIRYANRMGLFCQLETNGLLMNLENIKKLKKTGLHHVFVSIDSVNPEVHDKLRNKDGCFQAAIDGIKNCVKEGLSCSISTCISRENIKDGELKRIIELGIKLGVTSIRILYPAFINKWAGEDNDNIVLTEEEKKEVKKLLKSDFIYLESPCFNTEYTSKICPILRKDFFYISCYGEVQPCPFLPISFGNIRNEPLNKIIQKMWNDALSFNLDPVECLANDSSTMTQYLNYTTRFPINA